MPNRKQPMRPELRRYWWTLMGLSYVIVAAILWLFFITENYVVGQVVAMLWLGVWIAFARYARRPQQAQDDGDGTGDASR